MKKLLIWVDHEEILKKKKYKFSVEEATDGFLIGFERQQILSRIKFKNIISTEDHKTDCKLTLFKFRWK
jgi:hypothetical protein